MKSPGTPTRLSGAVAKEAEAVANAVAEEEGAVVAETADESAAEAANEAESGDDDSDGDDSFSGDYDPEMAAEAVLEWLSNRTPSEIVKELDKYIVGQADAKKAVAVALRNRWRRQKVKDADLRDEIFPNNLIMIGPTGVGKTEIARRLARLAQSPFVKVEASKFTEVGYVGRDVESMVRDLADTAVNMIRNQREEEVTPEARRRVEERLLDLLLPEPAQKPGKAAKPSASEPGASEAEERAGDELEAPEGEAGAFVAGPDGVAGPGDAKRRDAEEGGAEAEALSDRRARTREKLRALLRKGELEDRKVEMEIRQSSSFDAMAFPLGGGMEGVDVNFTEVLRGMLPKRRKRRTASVSEARRILFQEELDRLVDFEEVVFDALDRVEESGIVFLDELDKVAAPRRGAGPDVSREGVQRDLLPIVEGCNVHTKYGLVCTDHILFIAAGAFHVAKPSDLIPELQGRFPIRVELKSLNAGDFVRILKEPRNALISQYAALVLAEGYDLHFSDDALDEIARLAADLNDRMENIGARRLQTVLMSVLEDILFDLPERGCDDGECRVDAEFVRQRLKPVVSDDDLRRYIL